MASLYCHVSEADDRVGEERGVVEVARVVTIIREYGLHDGCGAYEEAGRHS